MQDSLRDVAGDANNAQLPFDGLETQESISASMAARFEHLHSLRQQARERVMEERAASRPYQPHRPPQD